jgi:hypothetical protein
MVARVSPDGPWQLAFHALPLPAADEQSPTFADLTLTASRAGLVATAVAPGRAGGYLDEVHAALVDPVTLELLRPWRRISAPGEVESRFPAVAPLGRTAVAVWMEDFEDPWPFTGTGEYRPIVVRDAYTARLIDFDGGPWVEPSGW